jgi:SAM-dependent methyltransferase
MISRTPHIYDQHYYNSHYGYLLDDKYYELLSLYWKYILFEKTGLDPEASTLDYGCGLGQVSGSLKNVVAFDPSDFASHFLATKERRFIKDRDSIPTNCFDYVLSSHSLEHSPKPYEDLKRFRSYAREDGKLILVLPTETDLKPRLEPDDNQHFQCWTFQTITNLLWQCGWQPIFQTNTYNPFLLKTLGRRFALNQTMAVRLAATLGRSVRSYPSQLTIAKKIVP